MKREVVINEVERCLVDEGYKVSYGSGCFDLFARKKVSMTLKVLMNIDSFTNSEADDLKAISHFLDTFPFLVGERANRYELEESVIYERFGVAVMSPRTFTMFVHGVMPKVKSRRGGFTVSVNVRKLKGCMEDQGISISELSSISGLSRKTLYKCRRGGTVDLETCEEIEKAVGLKIHGGVNEERVYAAGGAVNKEPRSSFKRMLGGHLDRLGFMFSFLNRSPFNLVIKEHDALVSLVSQNKKTLIAHADILEGLEREFDLSPVFITSSGNEKNLEGIPVVGVKEVKCMDTSKEFIERVEERR
jgi:putative transcriptional regulator